MAAPQPARIQLRRLRVENWLLPGAVSVASPRGATHLGMISRRVALVSAARRRIDGTTIPAGAHPARQPYSQKQNQAWAFSGLALRASDVCFFCSLSASDQGHGGLSAMQSRDCMSTVVGDLAPLRASWLSRKEAAFIH
jgi:hypothetical protein